MTAFKRCLLWSLFIATAFNATSQSSATRTYNLNGFSNIIVPESLDTLGQTIAKSSLIESILEKMSRDGLAKVKSRFNIDVAKSIAASRDSSVILFWPTKSLLYLLSSDFITDTAKYLNADQFEVVPNVLLQRKAAKYNSNVLKTYLTDKEKAASLVKTVYEGSIQGLTLMFPNIKVTESSSNYFLFKQRFPALKIRMKYRADENDLQIYVQYFYMIYRENYMYLVRFGYKIEEEKQWATTKTNFFANVVLR